MATPSSDPLARITKRALSLLHAGISQLSTEAEERESQDEMAASIAAAIHRGRHLIVQAGTGTGKSLAYLAPAIASGRTTVVATATLALQDQLAAKDLPALAKAGEDFAYEVLKGRSNYLCLAKLDRLNNQMNQGTLTVDERKAFDEERFDAVLTFAKEDKTGERENFHEELSDEGWRAVSVSSDECPGAGHCGFASNCFAELARERAMRAKVVVVNHHLYGAHLAGADRILPEHELVIFDEVHELEAVMTRSLGAEISGPTLRRVAALARRALSKDHRKHAEALLADADGLASLIAGLDDQRLFHGETQQLDAEIAEQLDRAASHANAAATELRRDGGSSEEARQAAVALSRVVTSIQRLRSPESSDVVSVEGGPRSPKLRLSPLSVAPTLHDRLFGNKTVIMTSATVPLKVGEMLGAPSDESDRLDLASTFDWKNNALLYGAAHIPDRRSEAADAAIVNELAELIEAAGGRTLGLFTSNRMVDLAFEALDGKVPHPILRAKGRSKSEVLEAFSQDDESCLFATMGFWQGVDIPGASLSLVVIDRLPFARPDDPLSIARRNAVEEQGGNPFMEVDLPRAATLLAQGVGRLIRTDSDKGVVAILDSRITSARYRSILLNALPPMPRTTDGEVAKDFLRSLRED